MIRRGSLEEVEPAQLPRDGKNLGEAARSVALLHKRC